LFFPSAATGLCCSSLERSGQHTLGTMKGQNAGGGGWEALVAALCDKPLLVYRLARRRRIRPNSGQAASTRRRPKWGKRGGAIRYRRKGTINFLADQAHRRHTSVMKTAPSQGFLACRQPVEEMYVAPSEFGTPAARKGGPYVSSVCPFTRA
jgi:hypothetical protein